MAGPASPLLSASQLATIAELGEERSARVGDVLFRVGDRRYPFIAIIEGEVAILDAAGNEIIRHGASGFLGEMNLLSGQTVFLTAVVMQPLRYIAVDRDALRPLLFEDGPLSDLLLSTFIARREALQQVDGVGFEIVGSRSSEATLRLVEFARSNRLPFTWNDTDDVDEPFVRLPGGTELRGPTAGEVSRALGIGRELEAREEVDLVRRRRRDLPDSAPRSTARPRACGRSLSRAPRSADRRARPAGSRTTSDSRAASAAPS